MPQRAAVNPEALSWARRVAGFSPGDAGKRAGASPARLAEWESGEAQPTLRQLRLLARAYRRPSAFFFRSTLPEDPPGFPDFRLVHADQLAEGDTPALRYAIRRARGRRQTALEIMQLLGETPAMVPLRARRDEGPETVGARIREFLEVSYEEQSRWRDHYTALREWTRATERRGVLVFQFSDVEVEEARGFSLPDNPVPVVALNGKDSPRGRIFTLMHELAHVALGQGGLCDLHDRNHGAWVEPFCNAAAAEALVPQAILLDTPDVVVGPTNVGWSDETLSALSNRFMVSREVILRRLLTLGLTTAEYYEAKRQQFLEEYRLQREGQGGFLRYYRRVLRDNGEAFTTLVLDAFDQQSISERDVSHHLGDVKLQHVDSIRGVLTGVIE